MPIDFIQERRKQKYLTIIVIAAFIITAIILWFGYFRKPVPVSESTPLFSGVGVKEIKIDFDLLESQFLRESQIFEKVSSFEGEIGRNNPFLPY